MSARIIQPGPNSSPAHGAQSIEGGGGGGGGGGGSTLGQGGGAPFPGSSLTPGLYRARFGPTNFPTRITLVNDNTLNLVAGVIPIWFPVDVDRPTVFVPIDIPTGKSSRANGAFAPNTLWGGQVLYWPNERPPALLGTPDALVSDSMGYCYLSNPGRWWLQYTNVSPGAVTSLTGLLVDANDPGVFSRLFNEPGCNGAIIPSHTANVYFNEVGLASVIICPASRNRTCLVIQNTGIRSSGPALAPSSVRICFGDQATTPAINNGGILLGVGASMTLSGPTNFRGPINAILDIMASGGNVDVVAQEFQ